MIERVAILGVGLVGGSLGLSWGKNRPDLVRIGFDRPEVLVQAVARGAVDVAAGSAAEAVAEADLVVLAAPIVPLLALLEDIAPHLKPGAVVTDVGSVKTPVMAQAADVLPPDNPFIGGHPMAGSERGGIAHADAFLFENATYVLCPPDDATAEAFRAHYDGVLDLVRATGARVLVLDAARHDRIAAVVSHLPQLLAVTLMNYVAGQHADDDAFLRLAAGGFRDMTRIASSPFDPWRDIIAANQGPLMDALAGFATAFQKTRNRVVEEDFEALHDAFDGARSARDTIPKNTKGFLQPLADLYVYAEDRPGELKHITTILFEAELNIKDIELLKIREGTGGAFRIGFAGNGVADAAGEALRAAGFTAYRL